MNIVINSKNKELVNTPDTYRPGTETVKIDLHMKMDNFQHAQARRKIIVTLKDPCFQLVLSQDSSVAIPREIRYMVMEDKQIYEFGKFDDEVKNYHGNGIEEVYDQINY